MPVHAEMSLKSDTIIIWSLGYRNLNLLIRLFNCLRFTATPSSLMSHYVTDSNHNFNERVVNSENNGQRFLRVLFSLWRGSGDLREANGSRKLTILPAGSGMGRG